MDSHRRSTPRVEAAKRVRGAMAEIVPLMALDAPTTPEERAVASTLDVITAKDGGYSGPALLKLERLLHALRGSLLHSK